MPKYFDTPPTPPSGYTDRMITRDFADRVVASKLRDLEEADKQRAAMQPNTELIDSAPGFQDTQDNSQVIQPGETVGSVAAADFKGDPRRVVGHPDNPASAMNMSELLRVKDVADVGEAAVAHEAEVIEMITEVPPDLQANQQ